MSERHLPNSQAPQAPRPPGWLKLVRAGSWFVVRASPDRPLDIKVIYDFRGRPDRQR